MEIVNTFSNEVASWVLPVVITLLVIVVVLFVIIAILRFKKPTKKNKSQFQKEIDRSDAYGNNYKNHALEKEIRKYKKLRNEYKRKLVSKNVLDTNKAQEDLKQILKQELNEYRDDQLVKLDHDIKKYKDDLLKKTILETMQPMHLKVINESSIAYIPVLEETKPFIIGKKGATIKKLSDVTNCNISVERESPFIEVSCPNPVDRTLAVNTIKHLIKSEAFDFNAIYNVYKKEKKLLENECFKTGKQYLDKLNIKVPNDSVCEYIGRLKYRWSFSQNVLEHCYEVALICEQLAIRLGLDPNVAKRVGFFHDIGKSIDYEKKYDHISSGIKIAKECDLPEDVIDGILKHHRSNCNDDYILLVRCADAWSAARTGARHVPHSDDEQTTKIIQDKLMQIPNILSVDVVLENEVLKVIFVPNVNNKKRYLAIKYEIVQAIKKDRRFNKYRVEFSDDLI